jgi:bifunctional DNA-binding transcriptional regulator/antitoxin component of YhaV-PrlF toxin-antitoxin module
MQTSFTSKISERGQTTIPRKIRELLGLTVGNPIYYEILDDRSVRLRKLERIDIEWARAIESTLTEWKDNSDDDL